ncbi:MAG: InlB B-repeat-containing protein, partial [Spirochaetota bacterium]
MINKIKICRIIIILLILAIGIINISCDLYYAEMLGIKNYNLEINYDNGKVWVSTDGATMPEQSTYEIREGTTVIIKAEESDGYIFDSWSGDITGTDKSTSFTMDSNKSVSANFREIDTSVEYTLDVSSTNGSVSVEFDGTVLTDSSPYSITEGASVTLTASGETGYVFDSWSGNETGTINPITFTMDSDKSITANFLQEFTLNISTTNGTVAVNDDGTDLDNASSYTIVEGSTITLTATPNSDYVFDKWSGNLSG